MSLARDFFADNEINGPMRIDSASTLWEWIEKGAREDVYDAWVAWMLNEGEKHESLVPFADLSADTQAEDSPFMVAVRSVARLPGDEESARP